MPPFRPRTILIAVILAIGAGILIVKLPSRTAAPESNGDREVQDDLIPVPDEGATSTPTVVTDGSPQQQVPATTPTTRPAKSTVVPTPTRAVIRMPYQEVLFSTPYLIGWSAEHGSTATITVEKNGTVVATIPACTNMPVRSNIVAYCSWTQDIVKSSWGTSGFTLTLSVKNAAGTPLETIQSSAITLVPRSRISWEPHRNSVWGWSVLYPHDWLVQDGPSRTVVARTNAGMTNPLYDQDAFTIEYCSIAHEACATRVDAFARTSGVHQATLGGKISQARLYSLGTHTIREDMLTRTGTALFVQRIVDPQSQEPLSPLVREGLRELGYITARNETHRYGLQESFRTGWFLFELMDDVVKQVRLYTDARNCSLTLQSEGMTKAESRSWSFTRNSCTVSGILSPDGTYQLSEDGCEKLWIDECRFSGRYTLTY